MSHPAARRTNRAATRPLGRSGVFVALLAVAGCADLGTGPDERLVNAAGAVYTVYPARSLLSSAAIVNGDLRTRRYDDTFHDTGLERLWPTPDVARFQWRGNRIGLLTTQGGLFARDRRSEWVAIATDVAAFQLEGNRIAALHSDGTLRVKLGVHGPWIAIATGVVRFQLEGDRIGILQQVDTASDDLRANDDDDDDEDENADRRPPLGTLSVRDGLVGGWVELAPRVSRFQLEGDRIAALQREAPDDDDDADALRLDGPGRTTLLVKDGITSDWTAVATGVRRFRLEGNRIGALYAGERDEDHDVVGGDDGDDDDDAPRGLLQVRDGIDGVWIDAASRVSRFALEGDRIGVVHFNGQAAVKDGIHGTWTIVHEAAVALQLQEGVIGVLTADGLLVREGTGRDWKALRSSFAGASQFRLLVDVPLVFRIQPPEYRVQADLCDAQHAEGKDGDGFYKCYPEYQFGLIVGKYGRFCGAGVPSDGNWDWAHQQGTVDPVDASCREHDHAGWYGIDPNDFRYHACVVRYAMQHSRLTVDGAVIEDGTAAWDDTWALMPRTKDARKAWLQESSGAEACNDDRLDQFTSATASPR